MRSIVPVINIVLAIATLAFASAWTIESRAQTTQTAPAPTPTPPPGSPTLNAPGPVPPPMRKTSWLAHLLRRTPNNLRLKTLEFPDIQIPILLIARTGSLRPLVEVRGKFNRRGWTLFAQGSPVAQASNQDEFKFTAFLNGRINEVVLTARGPAGEAEEERIYLFAPEAQEFMLISPWNAVVISAGFSSIDYTQTGFGNYLAYTGTIAARYSTFDGPTQLGIFASLDFTAVTLASQPTQNGPQFIEGKLAGTLTLPYDPNQSWKTQLLVGGSYVTVISNGSQFGISNLLSPEAGLRTRFILNPVDAVITDFRYVFLNTSLDSFNDRGFLASLTWSRTLLNSHRAELGLGYSQFSYQADSASRVHFGILSLLLGYSI